MGDKEEKITKEEAQKDEFSLPWSKNKNKDKKVRGLCSKSLPGAEMYFCFLFLFFFSLAEIYKEMLRICVYICRLKMHPCFTRILRL